MTFSPGAGLMRTPYETKVSLMKYKGKESMENLQDKVELQGCKTQLLKSHIFQ